MRSTWMWRIIIEGASRPQQRQGKGQRIDSNIIAGWGPIHPGEVLAEDVFPATGLSKTALASRLNISREALHNVLTGKSAISTVLALKLARLLGTTPQLWLNMQQSYDLAVVGTEKRGEIEKVEALDC